MDKEILLACRDAGLGYEGKAIWEHLDLQVRRGDYICIVGENGSGKSTLLKSLLGLLPPLSGRIERGGSLSGGAIGYLPQQTRAQKDFPATVTEVVRSGFLGAGGHRLLYTPEQKARALMNMGKLGILELSSQRVAEAIAETTGARVVTFYSCQTVSQADWAAGEGYLSLMRRNVAALREGIC